MRSLDATNAYADLAGFDRDFGPPAPAAVFDFDGVLTSPIEDFAYKLPECPGERSVLEKEAARFHINADIYDTPYLRHLVLQAMLEHLGELPGKGPFLQLAQQLTKAHRPFFILTARSGQAAIRRLLSFLEHYRVEPQEVFCVGRVPKGRQLALVRATVPKGQRVVYFEDTVRHARNSSKQDNPGVITVHVSWNVPPREEARALVERVVHACAHGSVRSVA